MDKNRFSLLEDSSENRLCFLCLKVSTEICPYCSIPYCCQEHYQQHYNSKLDYCFPFRVLQKPEVGRYVVATRDLEPLDLIMLDDPVLLGLNHDTMPACVECMMPMDTETTCTECSLRRCCQGQNWHALECKIFQENPKLDYNSLVLPIRALQLKETHPEKWEKFSLLMDQDEDNRIESELLEQNKANIEALKSLGYKNEDIMKVLGIIRMNSLKLQDPELQIHGITGRVVYPTLSYISHSCVCNARYKMSKKDHQITVRAQSEIKKGEEITIQYVSFMHGNAKRKKTFQKTWYFECKCIRCIDKTELNTFISALKCQQCINGFLLPSSSSKLSEWNCDKCEHRQNDQEIKETIDFCFSKLFEYNSNGLPDVSEYEELLELLLEKLHPNHYMVLTVKRCLAEKYSVDNSQKKIQFYNDFLTVTKKLDVGYPIWRGQVLFDYQHAIVIEGNRAYEIGVITKETYIKTLNQACQLLEESMKCFKHDEPEQEKMVGKALSEIKEVLFFSDFL